MTTENTLDRADVAALRSAVRGHVWRPREEGYQTVNFNVAVPQRPWAVVDVLGADDIAAVIGFAAANAMTVAVHATGHGATPLDGETLLIRTGALNTLAVDPESRTARIGAGLPGRPCDAAAPHGLAPLCGSAPSVGVVGLLTGGGVGPLVRQLGASSDYVRELTVVTGDGRVHRAAPDENPELFWGLRGGKATLGIVTEVVIELLPIPEFYGGAVYFDGADAAVVLERWRSWSDALPEDVDTSIALLRLPDMPGVPPMLAGKLSVAVRYANLAASEEAERVLAPMRSVATPLLDAVGVLPYAAIGAIHADPPQPMPSHDASTLLRELPAEAVDVLLDHVGPDAPSPLLLVEVRKLGGAFARKPANDSALCHRDAAFNVLVVGVLAPPIADLVPPAAASVLNALAPYSDGAQLPNFSASGDPAVIARSYDEETRQWLGALARQHDPSGVLAIGQVLR
ncbi:MAG: FAD-binding protein [Gordonia sp. (in: high G+C Gram-positive bacteria)]